MLKSCSPIFHSDGYTTDELSFIWLQGESSPVQLAEEMELPQFEMVKVETQDCQKSYITGKTNLKLRFTYYNIHTISLPFY